MYHEGSRSLQDRFDSRRLADRMAEFTTRDRFAPSDSAFIAQCSMFFLATADAHGHPDCSYRGGLPGFARVVDEKTLAFPNYDGNGMYRSLGNVLVNAHVGLIFIDFETSRRLRVNGTASLHYDDPLLPRFPGAQFMVRVNADLIFVNCPRYIHKMKLIEHSTYAPRTDRAAPEPEWKSMECFSDALPKKK